MCLCLELPTFSFIQSSSAEIRKIHNFIRQPKVFVEVRGLYVSVSNKTDSCTRDLTCLDFSLQTLKIVKYVTDDIINKEIILQLLITAKYKFKKNYTNYIFTFRTHDICIIINGFVVPY